MRSVKFVLMSIVLSLAAFVLADAQGTIYPPLLFRNEGSDIGRATRAVDCVGSGVNCTASGGVITLDASGGGGGAPTTATYITQTADAGLSAEQALGLLGTGYMKVTTTSGVVTSQAVPIPIADGGTNGITATAAFNNLAPCATQGNVLYYNGTDWVCLAVGTSGQVLQTNGAAANPSWVTPSAGGGDVNYTGAGADTAINSVTDVTVVTRDVTTAATDKLIVDAWFTILNNSTAVRVYVITLDFDGLFDIEITTGSLATSATVMHPFRVTAILDLRSTSLAYEEVIVESGLAAGTASGVDSTMAATHLRGTGWGTTASNATGTTTVALKIRSAAATATQTLRMHYFTIRKVTPT